MTSPPRYRAPRNKPGNGKGVGNRIYTYWPVKVAGRWELPTERPAGYEGDPLRTTLSPTDLADRSKFRRGGLQAWVTEIMHGRIGE